MKTIKDFVDSNALAWDVTREAFLSKLLDEIVNFPDVLIVIRSTQTYLIRRDLLSVKVSDARPKEEHAEQLG